MPQRLQLDGAFSIAQARFTSFNVQQRIDTLSRRGRGDTGNSGPSVVSNLSGRFVMKDGRIRLRNLTFAVPGSAVQLAGSFDLKSEQLDFGGHLLLDASLSETVTGFKSVLVKLAQPFFRRPGGGTKLPIRVSGTPEKPAFGLDVKRALTPWELSRPSRLWPRPCTTRSRRYALMNDDVFKGKWMQLKGQIKEKWGQLTDDDLDTVAGAARPARWSHPGALRSGEGRGQPSARRVDRDRPTVSRRRGFVASTRAVLTDRPHRQPLAAGTVSGRSVRRGSHRRTHGGPAAPALVCPPSTCSKPDTGSEVVSAPSADIQNRRSSRRSWSSSHCLRHSLPP